MTHEQLNALERMAEERLRVGDMLAPHLLLTIKALREILPPMLEWGADEGAHSWEDAVRLASERGPSWRLAEQEEWCLAPFDGPPPDEWYWMRSGAVINPYLRTCRMGRMVLPYARVRLVQQRDVP